jgi:hypothetical protein
MDGGSGNAFITGSSAADTINDDSGNEISASGLEANLFDLQ